MRHSLPLSPRIRLTLIIPKRHTYISSNVLPIYTFSEISSIPLYHTYNTTTTMSTLPIPCKHPWTAHPYSKSSDTVTIRATKGRQIQEYELHVDLLRHRSGYFRSKSFSLTPHPTAYMYSHPTDSQPTHPIVSAQTSYSKSKACPPSKHSAPGSTKANSRATGLA